MLLYIMTRKQFTTVAINCKTIQMFRNIIILNEELTLQIFFVLTYTILIPR